MRWIKVDNKTGRGYPIENGRYYVLHESGSKSVTAFSTKSGWQPNNPFSSDVAEYLDESIEGEDRDKELAELKEQMNAGLLLYNNQTATIIKREQEIERLKRLIEELVRQRAYDFMVSQDRNDTQENIEKECSDNWKQFKTDNNL